MFPHPKYYDLKTIEAKYLRHPREILLLADEGGIKLGVSVNNQEILLLRDGKNINCQKNSLTNAYDGSVNTTELLYLNAHHIKALLNKNSVKSSLFNYHKNGYDQALIISHNGSTFLEFGLNNLRISVDDISVFDPSVKPTPIETKNNSNEMHNLLREIYLKLSENNSAKVTTKNILKYLIEQCKICPLFPIEKIENGIIFWKDGGAIQEMKYRTLENVMTDIRNYH